MVRKRYAPCASVRQRPKPRKRGSIGLSCASSGCAYLPCALACQISTTASLTGLPSPSTTRPESVIRSPATPAGASSTTVKGSKPILTYGATVWEEVVSRLIVSSLAARGFHRCRVTAAQHDIVAVGKRNVGNRRFPVEGGDHALPRFLVGYAVVHRIVFEQRVAGKIHLRHQPLHQPDSEQRKMHMRRPPRVVVIAPGIRAGLDRYEPVAAFAVGQDATDAGEIRIERRVVIVDRVAVAPGGIRLPHFDQRMRDRPGVLVEDTSRHDDPLAKRLAVVLSRQVAVGRLDVVVAEHGSGHFG